MKLNICNNTMQYFLLIFKKLPQNYVVDYFVDITLRNLYILNIDFLLIVV